RGPTLGYRRRARLSVREVPAKGRVLVGFREPNGRYVADLDHCPVLDPRVGQQLAALAEMLGGLSVAAEIPQVEVACGDDAAALVIRHLAPMTDADLDRLRTFQAESGLRVLLQPGAEDSVHAFDDGPLELQYRLPEHGVAFTFLPTDFVQVNPAINQVLVTRALDLLDPGPDERVLDLFCGIGNFSLPLARRAGSVTGLEGDAALVERARGNARRNALDNARFEACDLYTDPAGAAAWAEPWDAVLLDPPRTGAEQVLPMVAASGAQRVLYVSCHPDSLARDAALLVSQHGFRLAGASVVDMFPHTAHMESIALFDRAAAQPVEQ
ncbi:MAG: methyltransferase domain-containing protein, partial [Xanthomonadales bacterium]|nr:methyltransferase domain-containing protein [Xanthomonadales bacterium]